MKYFLLKPEVAGGFGENTIIDHSVKPYKVIKLHYEFAGWLGDDLLETYPCFIGTTILIEKLNEFGFSGYLTDDVEISTSYEFRQFHPDMILPEFRWIKIYGIARKDDFGLSEEGSLVVSNRVLNILKTFKISQCDIVEYGRIQCR